MAPGGRQREPGASCGKGHALPFHPYAAAGRPSTFCAATTTTTTTLYRTSSPPACTAGLPHLRLPAHLQGQVPDPPRDLPAGGVLHRCAAGGGPAPARTGQARGAVDRQAALLPAAATQVSGGGVGGGWGKRGGPGQGLGPRRALPTLRGATLPQPPACPSLPASRHLRHHHTHLAAPDHHQCSASIPIFANLETSEKVYSSGEHMCAMDGWVAFHNSHLVRCAGWGAPGWVGLWGAGRRQALFWHGRWLRRRCQGWLAGRLAWLR